MSKRKLYPVFCRGPLATINAFGAACVRCSASTAIGLQDADRGDGGNCPVNQLKTLPDRDQQQSGSCFVAASLYSNPTSSLWSTRKILHPLTLSFKTWLISSITLSFVSDFKLANKLSLTVSGRSRSNQ